MSCVKPNTGIVLSLSVWMIFTLNVFADQNYQMVTVKPGDTLSYICFKLYKKYTPRIGLAILAHNPGLRDLNTIYVGQKIKFPQPSLIDQTLPPEDPQHIAQSPATPAPDKMQPMHGYITYLSGKVLYKPVHKTDWEAAIANTQLVEGDQIKVAVKAKAEIITEDQQIIRLNQNSILTINQLENNPVRKIKHTSLLLSLGSLWHKARKLFHPQSDFQIQTPNAISGVRGTVYSIDVNAEHNTRFRTYEGSINIYNQPAPENSQVNAVQGPHSVSGPHGVLAPHSVSSPHRVSGPHTVAAPHEVAGPHEVSMAAWTQILLAKHQELQINPKGQIVQKPFSPQSMRVDAWVKWNTERDRDFDSSPAWQ